MQEIMNYELYQISDIKECEYSFRDYEKNKFNLFKDYKLVYKNTISVGDKSDEGAVAELLYMIFNSSKRPEDFKGRSMSVSDVVKIKDKLFYCQSIGFKELKLD